MDKKDVEILQLQIQLVRLQETIRQLLTRDWDRSIKNSVQQPGNPCLIRKQEISEETEVVSCRFEQLQLGVPCFQHRPGLLHTWFLMKVTRNPTAEPTGKPNSSNINMINCGNSDTGYFHTITEGFRSSLMEGEIIYYHGTSAESANSILETGIDLEKSTPRQDFSNGVGFYVTPDLEKAVRKAKIKASMYNIPWSQGAIIGFRICEKLRKERRHLTLTLETEADKMVWTNVVLHYRNGEKSPDMSQALKHMKFIEGPAARYREKIPTPYLNYIQFCIREKDYARRFGSLENICFVIFFV